MSVKVKQEFDDFWKSEAIRVAVMEQLNTREVLDVKLLFDRARIIYIEGYRKEIHTWKNLASKVANIDFETLPPRQEIQQELEEDIKEEPIIEEKTESVELAKHEKKCPVCGEIVPATWKRHTYKKNGDKCGHVFEKK